MRQVDGINNAAPDQNGRCSRYLSHRVALVTGASRKIGIGAAIARALAAAGANIFITHYRPYDAEMPWGSDADAPDELLTELHALGIQAQGAEVDLADPSSPANLFDQVESALGMVHILVNNAAYSTRDTIDELSASSLDRHYAVNVRSMALLCVEFARRFRGTGGRIINMTSGQSLGPMPGELAYVATKGAVEAFTVSLSAELAAAISPSTRWIPAPPTRAGCRQIYTRN